MFIFLCACGWFVCSYTDKKDTVASDGDEVQMPERGTERDTKGRGGKRLRERPLDKGSTLNVA